MTARIALSASAIALLIWWGIDARSTMLVVSPQLPVDFVHSDHIDVGCLECHHNFNDDTGQGECYRCHKTDLSIAADMQTMFHELCRGCHVERSLAGEESGPVRVCGQCHRPNDAFM